MGGGEEGGAVINVARTCSPTILSLLFGNRICFNSLTTKKQTTKFSSENCSNMLLCPSYIILRIQKD